VRDRDGHASDDQCSGDSHTSIPPARDVVRDAGLDQAGGEVEALGDAVRHRAERQAAGVLARRAVAAVDHADYARGARLEALFA
jgi:hypothetical protein